MLQCYFFLNCTLSLKSSISDDFQCYLAYEPFISAFLQQFCMHNKNRVIFNMGHFTQLQKEQLLFNIGHSTQLKTEQLYFHRPYLTQLKKSNFNFIRDTLLSCSKSNFFHRQKSKKLIHMIKVIFYSFILQQTLYSAVERAIIISQGALYSAEKGHTFHS